MNAHAHPVPEQFDDPVQQREAATLGMWAFLATEILFFGVLFAGYTYCRVLFPQAFAAASRHTDMLLGTIETAVLLTSSCAVALSVREVQLGGRRMAVALLGLAALLGTSFLVMHGFEYYAEYGEGLIPGIHYTQQGIYARGIEVFYCLYYFITGFHSIHVAVGVALMLAMAWRTWHRAFDPDYHTPLELTALYWHLVDIVWIFVYPVIYLVGRAG
ncbi:MAG TPA: cytochrome c oxidase subunit 3 [Frateuria sp.]|uniref:cytochrome c oxidase subunit 3 n=1 Tax=Frateuria sp. TaxID=2211372 RepID=UPI002D7FE2E2|nr:cytochrome c oxidase subunit 3 [Frateuria sp.]HET6806395.1 cytochrome c oxidase subunit 3 [Frateuria sp.]